MPEVLNHIERPEAISFDVWMTLIRSNPGYKQVQADLIADRLGIPKEGFLEIMKADDRAVDKLSDVTGEQFGPTERLTRLLAVVGAEATPETIEQLSDDIQELFVEYPVRLVEPNLLGSLEQIKEAGYHTALLSNTGYINGEHMRQALGNTGITDYMDTLIFSNEVGIAKPDPNIYHHLAATAGVDLNSILHIGDNYRTDYLGPRNLGMQAVHLATETEAQVHVPTIAELSATLSILSRQVQ